ncbi:hypothetical protein P8C59_007739 [Phyllachora maydis]|uniref:Uncharacterized protein n=1 Tax=Phyllachora maydis TaxID=1825666 RepID=A0AAD9MDV0_9PEZI|nr:hypothetical protein P8C59_007739 [Phyllachora maydis]
MDDDGSNVDPSQAFKQWALQIAERSAIDWSALPQPMALSGLWGFSPEKLRGLVTADLCNATLLLQRDLAPPEVEAVAHLAANSYRNHSHSLPVTLGIAYLMARRGRDTLRFPFWTPRPGRFEPHVFPAPHLAFLRGIPAVLAWVLVRNVAYALPVYAGVTTFVSSVSRSQVQATLKLDPRLKALREAIQANRKPRLSPSPGPRSSPPSAHMYQDDARSDASAQVPQEQGPSEQGGPMPASPAPRSLPAWQRTARGPPQPVANRPDGSSSPAWSDDSGLLDEASPTAPAARRQEAAQGRARGTSTWDDIRRRAQGGGGDGEGGGGGTPAQASSWARRRQDAQNGKVQSGEQYSYSAQEQEGAYAKEQAQVEFDAMLERERRAAGQPGR